MITTTLDRKRSAANPLIDMSQSYSLTKRCKAQSDAPDSDICPRDVNVCRKCANTLPALYWTVNCYADRNHSFTKSISIPHFDVLTTWWSNEFPVAIGKKLAILQLKMQRYVGGGGLDIQLSMKAVRDMPAVNTHKYKYALELNIAGVTHRSAESLMVECNPSTGSGTVHFDVLNMATNDVPVVNSATITVNIAKTDQYCTPCAKAVDYFTGSRGRALHHVIEPVPTVHQTDPISSLPFEIRSKIFSLVGNQIRSFGSVAGVCREWWTMAYGDRQQHFSRTISLFAHSPDRTTPQRLATILAVCHKQVRDLWLDFYEITPSYTLACDATNLQTLVEHKKKLKFLAMTDLPKLRKYRLRVYHKCNEPDQYQPVMAFFDRCIPTLLEVELILEWGITAEQLAELMAAVSRSENVVKIKLKKDLDTSLGMPPNAKRNFRMPM